MKQYIKKETRLADFDHVPDLSGMKVYQAWLFQYIFFYLEEFHC